LVFITFTTFWHLVSADSPHMHTWSNSAERDLLGSRYSTARYRATMADLFAMLGNSHLVCVALSYAALGYFQYLFFYWIGYYFTDTLHLPKDQSRDATFTVTISMAIGMAIGGWLSAALCRYCRYRQACRAIALLGMGLSGVFAWLGAFASEPRAVVVAFSVAMASLGACESVFWTTASLLEPRRGGLAAAFINTGSNAGGLIAPSLTPWIANNYGWTMAITVASIICGGGGLIWLLIDPEAESQE
jgi:sugar phosphate permease